jgi:glycine cleavage system transcriptional repressor
MLSQHRCNIEDVSQTILQTEFAGIFVASIPDSISEEELLSSLMHELSPMGLSVHLKAMTRTREWTPPESEPFVITTLGPDRIGLVAGITAILADFGVNITSLKAVFRGGDNPHHNIMIYEVDIPVSVEHNIFRPALQERAKELGLEVNLQHRNIFETIHRV